MNLVEENRVGKNNDILSITRPQVTNLNTNVKTEPQLQTILKQKSIIKIFVDGDKYYIEHGAAYALGLINTRAIMLDNPKLVEITTDIHNKLKSDDSIEIEYIKLENKQSLKVYVDGANYCIDSSAAYALGLLNVEDFNNSESDYYYITNDMLKNMKEKYNVELHSLNLDQYASKKQL